MIVVVHPDASVTLEDADTFSAFSVRADGLDLARVASTLGPDSKAGEDDHVWMAVARLHALGRVHGGPDWRAGCDGMLAFAETKGWVDEQGLRVRAHIER